MLDVLLDMWMYPHSHIAVGQIFDSAHFGQGTVSQLIYNASCGAADVKLWHCLTQTTGCTHYNDSGVTCNACKFDFVSTIYHTNKIASGIGVLEGSMIVSLPCVTYCMV